MVERGSLPKQYTRSPQGYLAIACGTDYITVRTVQLEGKKQMSSIDFLNGHPSIIS